MKKFTLLENIMVGYDLIPEGSVIHLAEQPVTAPPKPDIEPATEPATEPGADPHEDPDIDPFRPPRPEVEPNPKALVKEDYEGEVSSSTANFWKNIRQKGHKHAFSNHPILALHGDDLSRQGYKHHEDINFNASEMMQLMMYVKKVEAPHKKELEELAKQIVVEIWGIPEELLEAKLTNNTDISGGDDAGGGDEDEDEEISPELLKQINKRITLNTLTQGAAVHQMMTMHHLIRKKLSEIDPNLIDTYDKLSRLMHKSYWYMNFDLLDNLADAAAGSEKIKWDKNGNPNVVAKAWIFPILAQELSKGVMELLTMHGYSNLDVETQKSLQKHADKLKHEPFLIMIGPTLWRKFIKIVPKDIKLADLVAKFSKLDPDEVHEIIDDVLDNPDQAGQKLKKLV